LACSEEALALGSAVFLALHFAFWVSTFDYTSLMSSVVHVATNPLFVVLASLLFLRESASRTTWTGILSPLKLARAALVFAGIFVAMMLGEYAETRVLAEVESLQ
jgi:drug/metabolite transporter (DMT)-like permease